MTRPIAMLLTAAITLVAFVPESEACHRRRGCGRRAVSHCGGYHTSSHGNGCCHSDYSSGYHSGGGCQTGYHSGCQTGHHTGCQTQGCVGGGCSIAAPQSGYQPMNGGYQNSTHSAGYRGGNSYNQGVQPNAAGGANIRSGNQNFEGNLNRDQNLNRDTNLNQVTPENQIQNQNLNPDGNLNPNPDAGAEADVSGEAAAEAAVPAPGT